MKLNETLPIVKKWDCTSAAHDVMRSIAGQVQPDPPPIRYFNYLENGSWMRRLYCPTCGMEWTLTKKEPIQHTCTKIATASTVYNKKRKWPAYNWDTQQVQGCNKEWKEEDPAFVIFEVRADDGLIVFGEASRLYDFCPNADEDECIKAGNYEFLRGKWIPRMDRCFIFLARYGFRAIKDGKVSTVSSEATTRIVEDAKHAMLVENTGGSLPMSKKAVEMMDANGIELSDGILKSLAKEHERIQSEKKPAKRSKGSILGDIMSYEPGPIPEKKLLAGEKEALFCLTDKIGNIRREQVYCPVCKKTHVIEYEGYTAGSFIRCPHCGEVTDTPNGNVKDYNSRILVMFDKTQREYLVIRRFVARMKLQSDGVVDRSVTEKQRIFFTPKRLYLLAPDKDGVWNTERINDIRSGGELLQDTDEIKEIISSSTAKYSGLIKAWGLDGSDKIEAIGWVGYYKTYLKAPYVETLLTAGMRSLVNRLMRDSHPEYAVDNAAGKTPCEILGISKATMRLARAENLNIEQMRAAERFHKADNSFAADDWREIMRSRIDTGTMFDIIQLYHIPYRKIMEYLDGCYGYQCIERDEAVTLWRDYLKMATDMEYDLSDKSRKYPRSLKKEHDKATFAYRAVRAEVRSKRFATRAKENVWLNYENEEFSAHVPQTPEEMVNEGVTQHHCIASYVDAVSDGRSQMLFIREKEEEKKPFFAMEIRDRKIVQVRGYCNCVPTGKKVLDFIYELARNKGLEVTFR